MTYFNLMRNAALALSLCLLFASCSKEKYNYLTNTHTPSEIKNMKVKIEKVYGMMTGHFSNKAQADTTNLPIFREQEIISIPIWKERKGEYWLSMGWFQANYTEKPLALGIFELKKYSRDTFLLVFYDVPNEEKYHQDWKSEKPFADLEPKDLEHQEGCEYLVVNRGNDNFEILPSGTPCKKHFMGPMHYFDFAGMISPKTQKHFHRFYDQDQNLLMTYPKPDGLNYDRLDKNRPKYEF
jgi:hypothetical protein